ncbi:unnamed protein product [Dibothriocephalus latus]|uniref:Uncharacterized protein n=1 Tax=Dibothriocephalus latus TaxID=60516 RepID=A0A3P6TQZ2_DIBLA|nr:unnamed protein product [Dibothriocephalus latus]
MLFLTALSSKYFAMKFQEAKEEALHDLESTRKALENEMKFSDYQKKERERLETLVEKFTEDLAKAQNSLAENEETDRQRVQYISELEVKLRALEKENREQREYAEKLKSLHALDAAADAIKPRQISPNAENPKPNGEQVKQLQAKVDELTGRINSLEGQLASKDDKQKTTRNPTRCQVVQTERLQNETPSAPKPTIRITPEENQMNFSDYQQKEQERFQRPDPISTEVKRLQEELAQKDRVIKDLQRPDPTSTEVKRLQEALAQKDFVIKDLQRPDPKSTVVQRLQEELAQKDRVIKDLQRNEPRSSEVRRLQEELAQKDRIIKDLRVSASPILKILHITFKIRHYFSP